MSNARRIIRLLGGRKIDLDKVKNIDMDLIKGRHWYIKRWPFPSKTAAITLKKRVLHRDKYPTLEIIMHEEDHVKDYLDRKRGFYPSWLWETVKSGYRNNRYEVKSRKYARKFRQ